MSAVHSAAQHRRYTDPAEREKTRQGSRGRTHSEETRRKISLSQLGKVMSKESREKMRAAKLGRKLSPAHIAKIRDRSRALALDPVWIEKLRNMRSGSRKSLRRFGLTHDELFAMGAAQGDLCAICRATPWKFIDHDHATGRIRGLLCAQCNMGLGQFRDDKARLENAITYLTAHARKEGL